MKIDNTSEHLIIIGKILVVLGMIGIPISIFSLNLMQFFFESDWWMRDFHRSFDFLWFSYSPLNLLYIFPGIYFLFACVFLVTGFGLVNKKNWAMKLAWLPGVLLLFKFPIGTALGIWLIYTLQKEKESRSQAREA